MKQTTLQKVEEALEEMTQEDGSGAIGVMILSSETQLNVEAKRRQKALGLPTTSVKMLEEQIAEKAGFVIYKGFYVKTLKTEEGDVVPRPITKYIDKYLQPDGTLKIPKKKITIQHAKETTNVN